MSDVDVKQPRKRLTPDERDEIVELKLRRVSVRDIAKRVECTTTTVQRVWKDYLRERSSERRKAADETLEDTIARLEQTATDARKGYYRAMESRVDEDGKETAGADLRAAQSFLNAERQALVELAKLGAVRDLEPEHLARITAEQLKVLGQSFRSVLESPELGLSFEQKRLAGRLLREVLSTFTIS